MHHHHRPFPPRSRARVGRPHEDLKNQENWDRSPETHVSEEPPLLVAVPKLAGAAREAMAQLPVMLAVGVA